MNDTVNILLLAAVGAGGYWLYQDREKHRRAAEEAEDALARRVAPQVAPVTLPTEPPPHAQRIRLAPRSYDPVFVEYGRDLPVAYLRALALHESGMNATASSGPAAGLLQVVDIVRKDFNERHGMHYERRDLLDPAINVSIAADVLARIIDGYGRQHPAAPNLRADWQNPLFVELLTFGWNAGMSERGGVGRVASYLERRGFTDFTIDDIAGAAKAAGASPNLSDLRRVAFAKAVATQFLRERARDEADDYRAVEPHVVAHPDEPVSSPDQVDVKSPGAAS